MKYQPKGPRENNAFRFAASSIERAQSIILTPTKTTSTGERWQRETEATATFLSKVIPQGGRVFDFGCGIGRISKALLAVRDDIEVVGVDSTPDMQRHAKNYVGESDRFSVVDSLRVFPKGHFSFGFAVYALQHVSKPRLDVDIARIGGAIAQDGGFYLLDAMRRFVPEKTLIERTALIQRRPDLDVVVDQFAAQLFPGERKWRWQDDGVRIPELLAPLFERQTAIPLPPDRFAPEIIEKHHSILFERT